MKPLRTRLLESRERYGLPWEVLERDYLLSWILAGIAQVDTLWEILIFKGGTALKKCYFGEYRFSEDLDFTAISANITDDTIEAAMQQACVEAVQLLDAYVPVDIICKRYSERDPHPRGQVAFDIHARFPWHRQPQVNVMVEITRDEKVLRPVVIRQVIHDYGEAFNTQLQVYSLEEIVAEKLRAILQTLQAFERKGWVRSRARDYYDLWRILDTYKDKLDLLSFSNLVHEKCVIKEVSFKDAESFFSTSLLEVVEKTWEQWLGSLVSGLPPHKQVISELREQVGLLLRY
jgi:uncharacterized protein